MRRHLALLCDGLVARGFTLSIAAPPGFAQAETVGEYGSRGVGEQPASHTPTLPCSPARFSAPITSRPHPLHDLRAALRIARHARPADLLHGHGLRGAWIAALAARLARKPCVFTAHNLAPPNPGRLARTLLHVTARRAAAIIAISQAVADSLAPYGIDTARIVLIPNGIDLRPFDRQSESARHPPAHLEDFRFSILHPAIENRKTKIVASVGRLAPEKGFDVLIEAAPRVLARLPEVGFILAGEGPERPRLEERIRKHGLGERFWLPGFVSDVPGLLTSADVVAVPSRSEGQGLVALEAMAARKPVVVSRVGGLVETVEAGVTGLLVPPDDPATLADALISLLEDEAARQRLGAAGRARVKERYTVDRMVEATVALYHACVKAPIIAAAPAPPPQAEDSE